MLEKKTKYAIIDSNKKLVEKFEDVVKAILTNRTQYPIGSKVVRIEKDGTFTLLAQNESALFQK
jgi:hypothetical protein